MDSPESARPFGSRRTLYSRSTSGIDVLPEFRLEQT